MKKEDKPMLDVKGQIAHMQSKGIKFERISLEEAEEYLKQNNNYFKLRAYRKNFPKHPGGDNGGKYIDLDFAMLKDLSIIDMRMRYVFLQMCLDIEHYTKVALLHAVENSSDDGYEIVEGYMDKLRTGDMMNGSRHHEELVRELHRNKDNPYCGGIISKYSGCFPVWAFIEIISLGTLIHFCGYCADVFKNDSLKENFYLLMTIKELRNASAHNNCLIHNMGAKDSERKADFKLMKKLSSNISKATRKNQLKNERTRQITTLIYAHSVIVTSDGVKKHTKEMLRDLVERMNKNIDFYSDNQNILKSFDFFQKAVDILL